MRWTWGLGLALVGCSGTKHDPIDPDAPPDGDVDTDADSDTDSDADADADTDDTAPDTAASPAPLDDRLFDAAHVLVVPDGDGLNLFAADGSRVMSATWTRLVGPCGGCGGEGASPDGDGLLLSFTNGGLGFAGSIARIDAAGVLDFRLDGFAFPHDAVRDPADQTIIVPEVGTFGGTSQLRWIAGDGGSGDAVRTLDDDHPDWVSDDPNGLERIDANGRTYLLQSTRGGQRTNQGWIDLWDITEPGSVSHVWTFPPEGRLGTPHGPVLRWYEDRWWLLWAHTDGAPRTGTVGLAVTDDPTVLPTYVADLGPIGPEAPFDFLRGVELTSDGWLYLTDSGSGGGVGFARDGRLLRAGMPAGLVPTGATGAVDADQVFVAFEPEPWVDSLPNPFEGWLWRLPVDALR